VTFCPFVMSLWKNNGTVKKRTSVPAVVSRSPNRGNEEFGIEYDSEVLHRVVDKAGIEVLELPCPNFDGCESKSKRNGWACVGHVKPEDRVKMCVEYNRYLNKSQFPDYRVFAGLCGRCLTRFTCGNEAFYPDCFQVDRQLVTEQ
jgi:hypothetical protein